MRFRVALFLYACNKTEASSLFLCLLIRFPFPGRQNWRRNEHVRNGTETRKRRKWKSRKRPAVLSFALCYEPHTHVPETGISRIWMQSNIKKKLRQRAYIWRAVSTEMGVCKKFLFQDSQPPSRIFRCIYIHEIKYSYVKCLYVHPRYLKVFLFLFALYAKKRN